MPKYNYSIIDINPVGLKQVSKEDLQIVNSFEINSKFIPFENNIEVHVYSLEDTLLYSDYNYTDQSYLQNSETAGERGASEITIDPIADCYKIGYPFGGVKVVYNFLDNLYSTSSGGAEFYIEEISKDRKELRLLTNQISEDEVIDFSDEILDKLSSSSYYDEFYLNFKNNDLFIGINLKTQEYRDYTSVVVKLYEPLPLTYKEKSILTIVEKVTESRGYEIQAEVIPDTPKGKQLKGPNFSVELDNIPNSSTEYLSYNDLFGYDTSNNYRELNALFKEKSINISIDYSNYQEFIHFSSLNERLRNFKYKLDLINSYQDRIDSYTSGSTTQSIEYFENQINTILENFDHYDRHLYFESGSTSWPKSNSTKPYINATGAATGSWYTAELEAAEGYDLSNYNQLLNSVPEYLREDTRNLPYATFVHMVAQHFDNLWVYTKAVTDKYDNDNRLDRGISKDLVQDALRNFGVNLYNSNRSISDLFKTFTGQFYQPGEEQVNIFVTSSAIPTSEENYTNEVYKRLYHNLPLLLKAKGTERGLRALISSFGIPTDNFITGSFDSHIGLTPVLYGGSRLQEKYTGPGLTVTSSLDKVRLDDTGSIVDGSTLSKDVSIVKRDDKYIIDSHPINIGYSPTDELEKALNNILPTSFNIDDYIGDPRQAYSSSYESLVSASKAYTQQAMVSGSHDLQDYTRILKFYDNVIFKMVKDFLPARSSVSSGIIIRPHALERNKIKQIQPTVEDILYTGSIDIGYISGSHGGTYTYSDDSLGNTAYSASVMTKDGPIFIPTHNRQEAKYDGELSGSILTVTTRELPPVNPFKYEDPNSVRYKVNTYQISACSINFEEPLYDQCLPPTATPTPTPTPTSTPGPVTNTPTPTPTRPPDTVIRTTVTGVPDNGAYPRYTVQYNIDGFDTGTFSVEGDIDGNFDIRRLRRNEDTVTGNGSIVIYKVNPTFYAYDQASIIAGCDLCNATFTPSSQPTYGRNDGNVQWSYSISNLSIGDTLTFDIEDTI